MSEEEKDKTILVGTHITEESIVKILSEMAQEKPRMIVYTTSIEFVDKYYKAIEEYIDSQNLKIDKSLLNDNLQIRPKEKVKPKGHPFAKFMPKKKYK